MPPQKLSDSERCLAICAFFFILISIVLALCIGLVLPRHWGQYEYVGNDAKANDIKLHERCGCERLLYTTNSIDCIPSVLEPRPFDEASEPETICNSIANYPYLVSLSAPAYIDDKTKRRFACTGTILSMIWVLAAIECVRSSEEWPELTVRAGSAYWSKDGTEHSLKEAARFSVNGPIAVKVDPPFIFTKIVNAVKIPKRETRLKWTLAVSPGWRKSETKKYRRFLVEVWSTVGCPEQNCNTGEITTKAPCTTEENKRALVTDTMYLVGFRTGVCFENGTKSNSIFSDLQSNNYRSWFKYLLENSKDEESAKFKKARPASASSLKVYEIIDCVLLKDQEDEDSGNNNGDLSSPVSFSDEETTVTESYTETESKSTHTQSTTKATNTATIPEEISSEHETSEGDLGTDVVLTLSIGTEAETEVFSKVETEVVTKGGTEVGTEPAVEIETYDEIIAKTSTETKETSLTTTTDSRIFWKIKV